MPDEKSEAKKEKEKIKIAKQNKAGGAPAGNMEDLEKMILAKKENAFGNFLNYMENKYATGKNDKSPKSKKRKCPPGGDQEPQTGSGKKRKI